MDPYSEQTTLALKSDKFETRLILKLINLHSANLPIK